MLLPILPQVLEVSCPRKGYSGTIDSKAGDSNFMDFFSMMQQLFKKSFNLKPEHLNLVFRMTWRLQSVQGLLHVNLPHAKDSEIQVSMLNCYELLCCSQTFMKRMMKCSPFCKHFSTYFSHKVYEWKLFENSSWHVSFWNQAWKAQRGERIVQAKKNSNSLAVQVRNAEILGHHFSNHETKHLSYKFDMDFF